MKAIAIWVGVNINQAVVEPRCDLVWLMGLMFYPVAAVVFDLS